MILEHFLGTDICDDLESIAAVMKKQNENGNNEFWISMETSFPFMGVLTSGHCAYVHFFDEEGSAGFSALSDDNVSLDADQIPVFYTNNASEIMEVEDHCILSLDKAIQIVQEFFTTKQMPQCIEWDEL